MQQARNELGAPSDGRSHCRSTLLDRPDPGAGLEVGALLGGWQLGGRDGQRCLADCGALDGACVCVCVCVCARARASDRPTRWPRWQETYDASLCCSGKALTLSWSRSRRSVRCDGSGLRWRFHTGAIAQLVAPDPWRTHVPGAGHLPVGRALSCGWRRNCLPSSPPVRSRQERGPSSM